MIALLPIIIPFFTILAITYIGNKKNYSGAYNFMIVLLGLNTIVSWSIALAGIDSSNAVAFDWVNLIDFKISFGAYWVPIPAYISAIANVVFLSVMIFVRQDVFVQSNDVRTPASLCAILLFLEILLASPHIGQIIFGWQGIVLTAFVLLGGAKQQVQNKCTSLIFLLAVNLIAIILFIIAVQMGNILSSFENLDLSSINIKIFGFSINYMDVVLIVFIMAVSIPMGMFPFNTWVEKVFEASASVASIVFGSFLLVWSYTLFHILLVMDISESVRIGIASYAIANMILSSTIAMKHRYIGNAVSHIYSAVSSTVLFSFAIGVIEYALLFALVQFIGIVGLVLTVGATVSALSGEQDMTKMGGLAQRLPGIYFMFFIIILSLSSIPPFSGFFARIWVLENLTISANAFWYLFVGLMVGQLFLSTVFGRIWGLVFYGTGHVDERVSAHIEKSNAYTLTALGTLSLMVFIVGWLAQRIFFAGTELSVNTEMKVSGVIKFFVPLIVTIFGLAIGFRKVVMNQSNLDSLYSDNNIWVNNLYIKGGLKACLFIPLHFIGKLIDFIERPAIGTLVNNSIASIARHLTKLMDSFFRAPAIISVLFSLLMVSAMIVLYITKVEGL